MRIEAQELAIYRWEFVIFFSLSFSEHRLWILISTTMLYDHSMSRAKIRSITINIVYSKGMLTGGYNVGGRLSSTFSVFFFVVTILHLAHDVGSIIHLN